MWRKRNLCTLLVGMHIGAATMGNSMEVSQKNKNKITISSSSFTPGYISEENENTNSKIHGAQCLHTHTHTHTHTMEYYSTIKKNDILQFATIWMDLESIMLSEISQTKTNTLLSLIRGI